MSGLERIGKLCAAYAEAHKALQTAAGEVREAQAAVLRKRADSLRRLSEAAATARETLLAEVQDSAGLFSKPKTRTIEGVKVGFRKQTGSVHIADTEATVDAVWETMPERAGVLIRTTDTPQKPALRALPAHEREAVGVVVDDDENVPFAKISNGDGTGELAAIVQAAEELA